MLYIRSIQQGNKDETAHKKSDISLNTIPTLLSDLKVLKWTIGLIIGPPSG